jgi:hypothetical protein
MLILSDSSRILAGAFLSAARGFPCNPLNVAARDPNIGQLSVV